METLDAILTVKISTIPNSGKGLFAKKPIAKGSYITEYLGKISTWKDADHDDGNNPYIYYINRKHVIDAKGSKALAHYANDASGFKKIKGLTTNSEYVVEGTRVFIVAKRDIAKGEEIFVGYGKDYWDTIRKNGIM
jgi:SET domain-containing protein